MISMKKLSVVFISLACLAGAVQAQPYNNWVSSDGTVWKNGTNEYCWRNAFWTPATAHPDCDGAIAPKKPEAPAAPVAAAPVVPAPAVPAPAVVAPVVTAPAPAVVAPAPVVPSRVTFAAAAFFDTNKAVLKPEGKAQLDDLLGKLKSVNWDVLVAVGHADAQGSASWNQDLSVRRAEAVKAYLLSKGLSQQQVKIDGKGSTMPVADNSTAAGRAKNRRVEVEVVGTAK
jgi:OOP family OmpA-OmpF porin